MDYRGFTRSNYFSVQDEEAFAAWAKIHDLEVLHTVDTELGEKLVGFIVDNDDGSIPTEHQDGDENVYCDFLGELSAHLASNWVATVIEAGHEGARYAYGYAAAVNSKGERLSVDLGEIIRKGKTLGLHCTEARY